MKLDNLKISIITVNYNHADGLENTIRSIAAQTYNNVEYIVIDGGSSDGSRAVLETHKDKIHYQISETDHGIFNAMNKGIAASTGAYLLFINSGDTLIDPNVIQDMVKFGLNEDLVYGNLEIINGQRKRYWIPETELTFNTFFKTSIPHQSTFIKRTLFDLVGLYNEDYRIVSDWEFFMVAVGKYNCTYKHIDRVVATFTEDGISSNPANYEVMAKERTSVYMEHFPFFYKDYERYSSIERELQKIAYFNKARHFVKKLLKAVKLGPS